MFATWKNTEQCDTFPKRFMGGKARTMISFRMLAALCSAVVWAESCFADCSSLHGLAQQHANDMARRNSLDHAGFMARRGPAGAVAENVAMGCDTEACARRMWMQSPPHRANMMLGGCQAVASAMSASGRRYWAMEIGGNSRAGARHTSVTPARVARRGSGHDGVVGRDFSIDGSNAP
jgi:cysteine-rich secretory family protein